MKNTFKPAIRILGIAAIVGVQALAMPVAAKEANAVGSSKTTQQKDGSSVTCTVKASDGGEVECVTRDADGNVTNRSTYHPRG